jgi:N-acetylglucosamine-6-phosphate deacetylase
LLVDAHVVAGGALVRDGWILVEDGVIADVGAGDRKPPAVSVRTSLSQAFVLPGFVDVHVHGGGGDSFDGGPAASLRAAAFHTMAGTTSLLAGLATLPAPVLVDQVRQLGARPEELEGGGRLLGVHLEGPFLSPIRKGAHDPSLLRPPDSAELSALCQAAPGRVRLITAAPELTGFAGLVGTALANGVIVSAGHTDADGPQLLGAIAAGVRSLTHTFNAMRPLLHRDPGPLEAIVDSDVYCELICDGIHVHPTLVRMLRRLAGAHRVILVTDAVAWAGVPDGDYRSGHDDVEVRDGRVRLAGTGTLAGSTLTMAEAVRRYARFTGAGVVELATVASTNAARLLGEDHRIGRALPGYQADLVVLDRHLACVGVMSHGRWARAPGNSSRETGSLL